MGCGLEDDVLACRCATGPRRRDVEYGELARVWGIGLLDTKAYAKERHEDKSGSVV